MNKHMAYIILNNMIVSNNDYRKCEVDKYCNLQVCRNCKLRIITEMWDFCYYNIATSKLRRLRFDLFRKVGI